MREHVVLKRNVMLGIASLGLAGMAHAGDGRLEINQACVATGCFAGDTPGFPIQTRSGKKYAFTSDVTLPAANGIDGVTLASSATLDLNGFSLSGPVP